MVVDLLNIVNGDLNVNVQNRDKTTVLYWAARRNYMQVVELLLGIDEIDVNTKDMNGNTPLHWAVYNGHMEVIDLLRKYIRFLLVAKST